MLDAIWGEQPSGYYCVSVKEGKTWEDHFFESPGQALKFVDKWKDEPDVNLYFCTTTLKEKRRIKETVLPSKWLWQDLDESDPRELGDLKPTIAWESSPGRYQALWKLDKLQEPGVIERLNKGLAKSVGADQGSWILTKVLRIPGTYNYKYTPTAQVKLLWTNGETFSYNKLKKYLPLEKEQPEFTDEQGDYDKIVKKHYSKLNSKLKTLLFETKPVKGQRSDMLWFLEHELIKVGLPVEDVYVLIKGSPWNKYKGRTDEDIRLRSELTKITEEGKVVDTKVNEEKELRFGLTLLNDTEFMSTISYSPGWMVNGFWTRRSHGIVAGEPKSFKSTLVLDMGVAVASGTKFLGQFEVAESGPVLIVQNENAPWILKDRLIKIRAARGLVGQVEKIRGIYRVQFAPRLPIYYINQQGFSLNDPFHKRILDQVMSEIKPKMVILDPLYLMFEGEVSQSKDLNPILTWLLGLKDKHECSLVLIHHHKKNTQGVTNLRGGQRMLGSVVLHGWVESAWYLSIKGGIEDVEVTGEDVNTPGGTKTVILEREFRGIGMYPRLDVSITMGDFNSTEYEVDIIKHKKGKGDVNEDEARDVIKNILELRGGKVSVREISKEGGISRRIVARLLPEVRQEYGGGNDRR